MNFKKEMERIKEFRAENDLARLVGGIDHIAYRVRMGDREKAVLEFMRLTPYAFCQTYNIDTEHALTTVLRAPDTPAIVVSEGLRKDTIVAKYVAEFGPRVHHTAYKVIRIEEVVRIQKATDVQFTTEHIIGDKQKGLLQIFTKPSPLTLEITEYIERFHGFDGFFLPDNVGALMKSTEKFNK